MENKLFVVFTTDHCKWCVKLKELMNCYGFDFYERNLKFKENLDEFKSLGFTKVPQVYLEGVLIGGYETSKLYFRKRFFENYPIEKQAKILEQLNEIE